MPVAAPSMVSDSLGVHLGWTLEIARGTGHVGQQIYNQGANILKV
jgi:hypothetical protein